MIAGLLADTAAEERHYFRHQLAPNRFNLLYLLGASQ